MKWPKWTIAGGRGDFLPIIIGGIILFYSVPALVMLLWKPDRNSGVIGVPLEILLGVGIIIGAGFVLMGIRLCTFPGTLLYRIAHGRLFFH